MPHSTRAKAAGRGKTRFFEIEMDNRLRERRAIQHELASAVERSELRLHYQPLAKIDGEVIGFEALLPLAKSSARAGFARNLHSGGRGKRSHIMQIGEWVPPRGPARSGGLVRTRLQIAGQSIANPVPPR